MKLGIRVGDVMTRNFIHADSSTNLSRCAKKMIKSNVGSLIIKEKEYFKGLLTSKDILRTIVEKKDISKVSADEIMSKKVPTIRPDKDLYDAILLMNKKKTRRLPVANSKKVIGMLTFKDILKIEPTLFDTMYDLSEIRGAKSKHAATGIRAYKERKALASGLTWIREGECDECGKYDALYNMEGDLLCEDCRDEISD